MIGDARSPHRTVWQLKAGVERQPGCCLRRVSLHQHRRIIVARGQRPAMRVDRQDGPRRLRRRCGRGQRGRGGVATVQRITRRRRDGRGRGGLTGWSSPGRRGCGRHTRRRIVCRPWHTGGVGGRRGLRQGGGAPTNAARIEPGDRASGLTLQVSVHSHYARANNAGNRRSRRGGCNLRRYIRPEPMRQGECRVVNRHARRCQLGRVLLRVGVDHLSRHNRVVSQCQDLLRRFALSQIGANLGKQPQPSGVNELASTSRAAVRVLGSRVTAAFHPHHV